MNIPLIEPPRNLLANLLEEWPLNTVGTDDAIDGGDVVEWLARLKESAEHSLSVGLQHTQDELRAAIVAYGNASFACGEWDRNESDESWDSLYAQLEASQAYLMRLLGIPADALGSETVSSPLDKIRQAIVHLRTARDLLRDAGAKRTLARVRAAISSVKGAERHASLAPFRQARKEEDPALDLEMFRRVNG